MKNILLTVICLAGLSALAWAQKAPVRVSDAAAGKTEKIMEKNTAPVRVRLSFVGEVAVAELFDNPASREFVSLLPLTMPFEDFARTEKIAYLPRKLKQQDAQDKGMQGDFAYSGETWRFFTRERARPETVW